MKSILLTTTALVAFAGAAAAEGHTGVSFSGEASLGYNDDDRQGNTEGFYWDAELGVALAAELDNGVMAGAEFTIDFSDNNLGDVLESAGYVLSLTTEDAGLFFGDVSFAAEKHWVATGWMRSDKFSEADGETAIRGDLKVGGFDTSISYVLSNNEGTRTVENDIDQLSLGARGDIGNFNISIAYQAQSDEAAGFYSARPAVIAPALADPDLPFQGDPTLPDFNPAVVGTDIRGDNGDFTAAETFGISVGTTVAGANVRLAYADNSVTDSIGLSASYPVGPVTLSAAYVVESDSDDSWRLRAVYADGPVSLTANYEERIGIARYNVEGSYDLGNGVVARAGYLDRDNWNGEAFYVSGTYDLGSGAELLVSYAEANDTLTGFRADDEVGAPEYQVGTTVEVSFKF